VITGGNLSLLPVDIFRWYMERIAIFERNPLNYIVRVIEFEGGHDFLEPGIKIHNHFFVFYKNHIFATVHVGRVILISFKYATYVLT